MMAKKRNENAFASTDRRASASSADSDLSILKKQGKEGGYEAWATVLGSFLVYYSSYGLINSFGFFQHYYQDDFLSTSSPTKIAFIGTMQIALMNSLATVSGALCDCYGSTYLYIGSGLGTASTLVVLSLIPPGSFPQVFTIQGLSMGISIAFGVQPALTVVGQHFRRRRAFAMGVVASGCALGGACFPIMFAHLLPIVGFNWALRVAALKIVVCYSIALCISRGKPTPRKLKDVLNTLFDLKGFLDARYSVLCIGAWIAQIGIWVPNYYIGSYCSTLSEATPFMDYFLPLMNGTSIIGMIIGGLIGDKIGRLNFLYPITMILGLLCIVWALSTTVPLLILFVTTFGFFSGIFTALLPSVVSQISPDERLGGRVGAFYSMIAVSSFIGTPIGGALVNGQTKEAYIGVIIYAGGTLALGAIILLGSRLLHDRNLQAKW